MALMLFAAPLVAEAQQTAKVRRIGYLSGSALPTDTWDGVRQGLREQGYFEGRNLLIEVRSAEAKLDRLPHLAAELVSLNVEVIVAASGPAAHAAKNATSTIPIVFTLVVDPVASGFVTTLARPTGNITGISSLHYDLLGKQLELLKEALPSLKSVALLKGPVNPETSTGGGLRPEMAMAARHLRLEVYAVEARTPGELGSAFTTIARRGATAVVVVSDPGLFTWRHEIVDLAIKRQLPLLGWQRQWAAAGALVSYGPNNVDLGRRAGALVSRILNGAKPADLPVEQPTTFELAINLKTAKAVGLTIPQTLLLRADQVIE